MDETRKIQCSCGQENQLVFLAGKWHYDIGRHGNGEPCGGKCFNCRALLIDSEIFPAESSETPGKIEQPEAPEAPKEISMSMKRKELFEAAEKLGLKVSTNATKVEILKLIERAQEDEAQEEPVVPADE